MAISQSGVDDDELAEHSDRHRATQTATFGCQRFQTPTIWLLPSRVQMPFTFEIGNARLYVCESQRSLKVLAGTVPLAGCKAWCLTRAKADKLKIIIELS